MMVVLSTTLQLLLCRGEYIAFTTSWAEPNHDHQKEGLSIIIIFVSLVLFMCRQSEYCVRGTASNNTYRVENKCETFEALAVFNG